MPAYERQAEPSVGQKVLCVTGILGLQALFNWMDAAPLDDLLVAAAMLLGLVGAGACYHIYRVYRITRRR